MAHSIERINRLIREEISELLLRYVKDPRLGGFIAITEVDTTPDLKSAKVYVSQFCESEKKQETLSTLTSASGFFRRELAKRLKLRYTPELIFQWDNSIEHGTHILEMIDKVVPDEEN